MRFNEGLPARAAKPLTSTEAGAVGWRPPALLRVPGHRRRRRAACPDRLRSLSSISQPLCLLQVRAARHEGLPRRLLPLHLRGLGCGGASGVGVEEGSWLGGLRGTRGRAHHHQAAAGGSSSSGEQLASPTALAAVAPPAGKRMLSPETSLYTIAASATYGIVLAAQVSSLLVGPRLRCAAACCPGCRLACGS